MLLKKDIGLQYMITLWRETVYTVTKISLLKRAHMHGLEVVERAWDPLLQDKNRKREHFNWLIGPSTLNQLTLEALNI